MPRIWRASARSIWSWPADRNGRRSTVAKAIGCAPSKRLPTRSGELSRNSATAEGVDSLAQPSRNQIENEASRKAAKPQRKKKNRKRTELPSRVARNLCGFAPLRDAFFL